MNDLHIDSPADGVRRVTLDRPERKNALSAEMIDGLIEAVTRFRTNDGDRVLLLAATGKVFCAGVDVSHRRDGEVDPPVEVMDRLAGHIQRLILTLYEAEKPTIAAVGGAATGGGVDLSLACDFRVAAESARFAETYVRMGLVPAVGGCYLLPKLLGTSAALELLLTGDFISADRALELGLVSRVVADEVLEEEALALASRLAAGPPIAIRMIKQAVAQSATVSLADHLATMGAKSALIGTTEDAREGVAAFFEKRPATFRGR
jgi:enoyl-CoA hydratase/carnithine racemase